MRCYASARQLRVGDARHDTKGDFLRTSKDKRVCSLVNVGGCIRHMCVYVFPWVWCVSAHACACMCFGILHACVSVCAFLVCARVCVMCVFYVFFSFNLSGAIYRKMNLAQRERLHCTRFSSYFICICRPFNTINTKTGYKTKRKFATRKIGTRKIGKSNPILLIPNNTTICNICNISHPPLSQTEIDVKNISGWRMEKRDQGQKIQKLRLCQIKVGKID